MKYLYEVIKSKSPKMKVGFRFVSEKLHDDRRKDKTVELSDVACRDYTLKLIKTYTDEEWREYKKKHKKISKRDTNGRL
jgi:hypothetical protein